MSEEKRLLDKHGKELNTTRESRRSSSDLKKVLSVSKNVGVIVLGVLAAGATTIANMEQILSFLCKRFDFGCEPSIPQPSIPPRLEEAFRRLQDESSDPNIRLEAIRTIQEIRIIDTRFDREILEQLSLFVRTRSPFEAGVIRNVRGTDIEEALSLIGYIPKFHPEVGSYSVDLTNVDISGARLVNGNFENVEMWGSNLRGVVLNRANLADADLGGVDFTNASLERANLERALLWCSDEEEPIRCSIFDGTRMSRANLNEADFTGANMLNAKGLTGEQIRQASLCNTILPDSTLSFRDCKTHFRDG